MNDLDASQWAVPLAALCASAAVSWWYRRRHGWRSWPLVWKIVAGGLLAARLSFVLQNAPEYAAAPLSVFDLGDGGWSDTTGILAAFVLGAHLTASTATPRRPVLAAVLAGAAVWIGGTIAMLDSGPASPPVPLVELRRLDGTLVQLRTMSDKPMVVNLWATWCPPCRREMPAMRDAQRLHPGITFVFVNQGEDSATVLGFLAQQRLELDNVLTDRAREVGRRTGSFAMPTTLFYGGHGRLLMRHVGELDRAGLDRRLKMLAPPGQAPRNDPPSPGS